MIIDELPLVTHQHYNDNLIANDNVLWLGWSLGVACNSFSRRSRYLRSRWIGLIYKGCKFQDWASGFERERERERVSVTQILVFVM